MTPRSIDGQVKETSVVDDSEEAGAGSGGANDGRETEVLSGRDQDLAAAQWTGEDGVKGGFRIRVHGTEFIDQKHIARGHGRDG